MEQVEQMELWQLYDKQRNPLDLVVKRDYTKKFPRGMYHVVVECIVIDKKGMMLITQRAPGKHHEGLWEVTTGSIQAGETSITGVQRELFEETGIRIQEDQLILLKGSERTDAVFRDTYLAIVDDLTTCNIQMQETETSAYKIIPLVDFQKSSIDPSILPETGFVRSQYIRLRNVMGLVVEYMRQATNTEREIPTDVTPVKQINGLTAKRKIHAVGEKTESQQEIKMVDSLSRKKTPVMIDTDALRRFLAMCADVESEP